MDEAVVERRVMQLEELVKKQATQIETLRKKVEELDCKAGFARNAELERVKEEREAKMAAEGTTTAGLLEAAKVQKPTEEDIENDIKETMEKLDEALADGKIDQAKYDKIKEQMEAQAAVILEHIKKDEEEPAAVAEEEDRGGWFDNKKEKEWYE